MAATNTTPVLQQETTTKPVVAKRALVPKLRFKEFDGEWARKDFGSIAERAKAKHDPKKSTEEYPCIEMESIEKESSILLDIFNSNDQLSIKNKFKKGEILFGKLRPNLKKHIIAPFDGVCSSEIWVLKGKKLSNDFLFRLVQTNKFYASTLVTSGSKMPRADWDYISSTIFPFPSLPEQQKIASFLTAVDEKIQQLTKKKELLAQYKKGVMQQLFSGKLRFKPTPPLRAKHSVAKQTVEINYPDWEEKLLGKLIEICSSKRVLQKDWKEEGVPFLRTREIINLSNNVGFRTPIFITDELFEELKLKYGVPKSGDILATGVGTIGQLYIVNQADKFYFKDGNVIWFKMNDSLDSNYLNQIFKTRFIRKQLNDNASITTVATFTIDGARKTKIIYPCIDEQQKIANYLSAIDDKIETVNQQISKTQTFKKGLLQQLFV
ncbi:restriction endonuclease subunit S [Cellulophaga tyrosinoxydans]|uniref:Type I restriction enzyme, S subunit n=1 Tax=Cellulophaga tyrosinoxydans TaxID=504486 RepID=A0A1W1ZZK2_9FLAO|nr:restriction endonuclease subunit S [Cellulophaga tyrosinoxydans]SMC53857.1 type I restriction enzyme, S subunit [Cellulophaga tyrosinoxydans]